LPPSREVFATTNNVLRRLYPAAPRTAKTTLATTKELSERRKALLAALDVLIKRDDMGPVRDSLVQMRSNAMSPGLVPDFNIPKTAENLAAALRQRMYGKSPGGYSEYRVSDGTSLALTAVAAARRAALASLVGNNNARPSAGMGLPTAGVRGAELERAATALARDEQKLATEYEREASRYAAALEKLVQDHLEPALAGLLKNDAKNAVGALRRDVAALTAFAARPLSERLLAEYDRARLQKTAADVVRLARRVLGSRAASALSAFRENLVVATDVARELRARRTVLETLRTLPAGVLPLAEELDLSFSAAQQPNANARFANRVRPSVNYLQRAFRTPQIAGLLTPTKPVAAASPSRASPNTNSTNSGSRTSANSASMPISLTANSGSSRAMREEIQRLRAELEKCTTPPRRPASEFPVGYRLRGSDGIEYVVQKYRTQGGYKTHHRWARAAK
jgi:hypothetical protein